MKNIFFFLLILSFYCSDAQDKNDWANLKMYKNDNEVVMQDDNVVDRVVFMGNSITQGWKRIDSAFFIKNNYINRGISGQVTSQMLVRFRPDVIDLKPKAVVILAGINDIAQNLGPISLEQIFGNIASMAELAKSNGIKVILCSVLPAQDFRWRPGMEPAPKVIKLNAMIKAYATKQGHSYVDYHSAMKDEKDGLKIMYGEDGVHPNLAGYKVMEPLLQKEIKKSLASK